jgi:hypothetical protein
MYNTSHIPSFSLDRMKMPTATLRVSVEDASDSKADDPR